MEEIFITPEVNRCKIDVDSFPKQIGVKQLESSFYPTRILYELDFNYKLIREEREQRHGADADAVAVERDILDFIDLLKSKKYTFSLARQYRKNKEVLILENVLETERKAPVPKRFFKLALKTINDRKGHWLDTGEFVLSVSDN